jgi:hypothetical protein
MKVAKSSKLRSLKRWAHSPMARVRTPEPSSVPGVIAPTSKGPSPELDKIERQQETDEAVAEARRPLTRAIVERAVTS